MQSRESITQMYSRFTDITNGLAGLGKTCDIRDMVRKILRSLPGSWTPKVTAIEEANDLRRMSLEKLIGSLMAHGINMERLGESSSRKKHSNTLKGEVMEKIGQPIRSRKLKKSGFSLVGSTWTKTSMVEGEGIIGKVP
ncbi:hypothetical protein Taro_024204 [Colocasia esculenta]|uniref:UBN2 domain-containing protein n=1 Tax=Colocasia esculenta TaxID=4460 RepID=A0A843VJN7_COLES|nr:hypothetical protein [Colocasia esculenta]